MSKYTIAKHEVIYQLYEVDADSEKEAIKKVKNNESDIKELVGQGSYDCDIEWDTKGYFAAVDEEELNRYKAEKCKYK